MQKAGRQIYQIHSSKNNWIICLPFRHTIRNPFCTAHETTPFSSYKPAFRATANRRTTSKSGSNCRRGVQGRKDTERKGRTRKRKVVLGQMEEV